MGVLTELVNSVLKAPGEFATVAAHDPLSAVLMAFGALFVAVSVGVFGYLSAGAVLNLLTGEDAGEPRRPM